MTTIEKARPSILKLVASIIIDVIGMATFIVPGLGEVGDTVWAPISAILIHLMYGNSIVTIVGFAEEFGPGSDFIPTATLTWLYVTFVKK